MKIIKVIFNFFKSFKIHLFIMKLKSFLLVILTLLVGCNPPTEETTTETDTNSYYDPRVPFGTITPSGSELGKLLSVTADSSQLKKITLNWIVPPIYQTMDYSIKIYKKRGDDPLFVLPDPSDPSSAAPLFLRATTNLNYYVDQDYYDSDNQLVTEVEEDSTYTYWLYLNVGDKWSSAVKIVVTAGSPTDSFKFPSAADFWKNLRWSIGYSPVSPNNPTPIVNVGTMNYSPLLLTSVGNPVGGVAWAYSGNVMYYADTVNNRVVIYTRGLAYTCDQYQTTDPSMYLACTYQYASAPLTAVNILGQNTQFENKTCSQINSLCGSQSSESSCNSASSICSWNSTANTCSGNQKCLNAPSRVTVADNKLFISDSGNNRVVVYNTLPTKGCDKEIIPGFPNLTDCNPSFVVGKKGLSDLNTYPVGIASLNNPTAVAVKSNNLYIADTNNNRVVMIKSYADNSYFNCEDPLFWEQSLCSFSSVLGQKDFVSKWSFKDGSNDGSNTTREGLSGYDGITCVGLNCTSPLVTGVIQDSFIDLRMGRYFKKPTDIAFSDNKLMIASNEEIKLTSPLGTSQLRGRVMVWDNNPLEDGTYKCNTSLTLSEYDSNNNCQASRIIGQSLMNKLLIVSPTGKYSDSAFALDSFDAFDIKGTIMVGVDSLNNFVYQWNNFLDNSIEGTPPTLRITNPNGAVDNSTGQSRYLPNLNGISDITITPTNLIFISDPGSARVFEIRAFEYETPQ